MKTESAGPSVSSEQEEKEGEEQSSKDSYESLSTEEELDEELERAEGERHEEELLGKYSLWEDEKVEALLDDIYDRLTPFMKRTEVEYDLLSLDAPTPFASSCPNGAIYFTKALIEMLEPDEVLFFAAHELAHTELRHYASRRRRLSELRQLIPAPPGSPTRQRLELAAVLSVRHQEEFEADFQAGMWLNGELGARALSKLHEVCRKTSPTSLNRPTHPRFEKRVAHLRKGTPFPPPLEYLYSLIS